MASSRLLRRAARVTATLVAGAAVVTVVPSSALADPVPTIASVQAEVDALHHQAGQAAERYNDARLAVTDSRAELAGLRAQIETRAATLVDLRTALGSTAATTYRSGGIDPAFVLVLSEEPEDFFQQASALNRLGERQGVALGRLAEVQRAQEKDETAARATTEALSEAQNRIQREKATVEGLLAAAETTLDSLRAAERARLEAAARAASEQAARDRAGYVAASRSRVPAAPEAPGAPGTPGTPVAPAPGASTGAAAAVAAAYEQLGKPYVWGASGPGSFDCSGLTAWAWKAAGVSLPHSSRAQAGLGSPVARADLQPGDLVFYYSPISHVGIYVGDGKLVHASRAGRPVQVAEVDSMPFTSARRVG